jgi:hypothetical protein
MPGTWLADHHPDWLTGMPETAPADQVCLFNFGKPEALSWAISHFDWLIRSQGAAGDGLESMRRAVPLLRVQPGRQDRARGAVERAA